MEESPWKSEKWWVSPFNYAKQVRSELRLPDKVHIYDTTLRDGEETPGVFLRKKDKIRIAQALDDIGIDRIEAGMPGTSAKDRSFTKKIVKMGLGGKIFALCHAEKKEIDTAIDCDVGNVTFIIPIGEPKNSYQYKFSPDEVIDLSITLIEYAKAHGLFTVVSPYDTTRADFDFLKRYLKEVILPTKSDGLVISDTVGCTLPISMAYLVSRIKELVKIPIEVHTHNDFGLATAGALAAVGAGAEVVDGTMNGLGEGTGVAATEEIVLGLKLLYGLQVNCKIDKLYETSKMVEELSGIRKSLIKPIVGERIFGREFASALKRADAFKSLLHYPLAIRPMAPSLLGRKATVYIGRKSGTQSIHGKLEELGLAATDEQVEDILSRIRRKLRNTRRVLSNEDFISIWKKVSSDS